MLDLSGAPNISSSQGNNNGIRRRIRQLGRKETRRLPVEVRVQSADKQHEFDYNVRVLSV